MNTAAPHPASAPAARRAIAAALLLVAGVLVLGRAPLGGALAALSTLGALAIGPRITAGPLAQRLFLLILFGLGIATALHLPHDASDNALGRFWLAATLGLLFPAAGRLCLHAPEGGVIVTTSLALLALTTAGKAPLGPAYSAAVVAHLLLVLLALRAADPGRPAWREIPRRSLAIGAALLLLGACVGVGLSRLLPPLAVWSQAQLLGTDEVMTGFGERLWLGSMEGMLQSDTLVLRLEALDPSSPTEGPNDAEPRDPLATISHLRGVVYDHYERGRWTNATRLDVVPAPPASPGATRTLRATLLHGSRDRYFLPLGADRIAPRDDAATIDRFGVLRLPIGDATAVDFDPKPRPASALASPPPSAPPAPQDLDVPPELRPDLERLVASWTSDAQSPAAKVTAIADHLQRDYTYSLSFTRAQGTDPLLDFLLRGRSGHCEYFATATVLLTRVAGVPARLVVGYQVAERSPLGGHALVRERDAHAWAEVHLPTRGWITLDATPASATPEPRSTPFFAALQERLASAWASLTTALTDHLASTLAGLAAVLTAPVAFRMLRRLRKPPRPRPALRSPEEPPPPELTRLFAHLASLTQGSITRAPTETLERFAQRLAKAGHTAASEAITRYAALRYGGIGEQTTVLAALTAATTSRPPASSHAPNRPEDRPLKPPAT
ncbi:transglutaminase-like domain-containing protein [Chondromyces crocatus]|uniref:Transglutaminase-like domain-containing protein n=1 Tax=Chondromyces crocatus TaxID=52 RepID=A0A0K1EEL0_CHOCO|nr:transglutaminase-like domain-containing protein [Chondromyces crocatus]AKT39112.1 uncharacterized protein CMC5_032590 [Chondromyces crocatus]